MKEFRLMERGSGNGPKKTKIKKAEKVDLICAQIYSMVLLGVHYKEKESNKIVTLGPN